VVEADGTTAASWQRGANNVLALQMNDEEVEVYDNWWVGVSCLQAHAAASAGAMRHSTKIPSCGAT